MANLANTQKNLNNSVKGKSITELKREKEIELNLKKEQKKESELLKEIELEAEKELNKLKDSNNTEDIIMTSEVAKAFENKIKEELKESNKTPTLTIESQQLPNFYHDTDFNPNNTKNVKADSYLINPNNIKVIWSNNPRYDYGRIEELEKVIAVNPQEFFNQNPVNVFWSGKDNCYVLDHGYRRMRTVLNLINKGHDIKRIKCNVVLEPTRSESIINHMNSNNGKPFTQLEYAFIFDEALNKCGYIKEDLIELTGKSLSYINAALDLIYISEEMKEDIKSGLLNTTTAVNIAREAKKEIAQEEVKVGKKLTKKEKEVKVKQKTKDNHKALKQIAKEKEKNRISSGTSSNTTQTQAKINNGLLNEVIGTKDTREIALIRKVENLYKDGDNRKEVLLLVRNFLESKIDDISFMANLNKLIPETKPAK